MEFFNKYKNIIRLIISLLLFFFSYLVQLVPIFLFDIDVVNASDTTLYALQAFSNSFMAICIFLMYRKELISKFKEFIKNFWDMADISIKYWLIGLCAMAVSNILISTFSPVKIANNEAGVQDIITSVPFIALFLTTVLAPFTEEMIFRKAFRDVFPKKMEYILLSGIIFGALHVISSVTSLYDYLYIIPYSSLGIAFAALYYKTDNIFTSIFVHMLHNGILTILSIVGTGMILC